MKERFTAESRDARRWLPPPSLPGFTLSLPATQSAPSPCSCFTTCLHHTRRHGATPFCCYHLFFPPPWIFCLLHGGLPDP